jgi:hypothetical protein
VHKEDPQLGRVNIRGNAKNTAKPPPVALGNPACFPRWIMTVGKIRDDAADQGFKGSIPAELRRVDLAVGHDDPAEIARLPNGADQHIPFSAGPCHCRGSCD